MQARADFAYRLGEGRGVIAGCCARRDDDAARERPFWRASGRIAPFFGEPRREVDVLSAHVFGYGSEVPVGALGALRA